jgi:hypothetical protein
MIGTGVDGFATLDDLMKDVVKTFPDLFEGSGAGGGGAPHKNGGGGGAKTWTQAEFNAAARPRTGRQDDRRLRSSANCDSRWRYVDFQHKVLIASPRLHVSLTATFGRDALLKPLPGDPAAL